MVTFHCSVSLNHAGELALENTRALELENLNGCSKISLITPVLFLLWHLKMPVVKTAFCRSAEGTELAMTGLSFLNDCTKTCKLFILLFIFTFLFLNHKIMSSYFGLKLHYQPHKLPWEPIRWFCGVTSKFFFWRFVKN